MNEEHVVVDKCAKQKTNIEDEYPQNDGEPKQTLYWTVEYEIPKAASEAQWGWVKYARAFSFFSNETGGTVLDSLKTIYLIRSDTNQGWITKIKTRGNNRIYKTSSRFVSRVRVSRSNADLSRLLCLYTGRLEPWSGSGTIVQCVLCRASCANTGSRRSVFGARV